MNQNSPEALSIALFAVLFEAKSLGYDVDAICKKATDGMVDGGKTYRGGSANWVVPANEAIETALKDTHTCSK
ncbi:MAG: hypothetical protein V4693_03155 [Pseudomonadota bacterium]